MEYINTTIIDDKTLQELNKLLFGNESGLDSVLCNDFTRWRSQGFQFSENVLFGLVQNQGGPCGVLAVVQAFLIKNLFFPKILQPNNAMQFEEETQLQKMSRVNKENCEAALFKALAEIIRKSASKDVVLKNFDRRDSKLESSVVVPVNAANTEKIRFVKHACNSSKELEETIALNKAAFFSDLGVICFVFSVLLTRGVERVRSDMDDSSECLIRRFGYSSQELVNLLITGQAVSNVFDNSKKLDHTTDSEFKIKKHADGQKETPELVNASTNISHIGTDSNSEGNAVLLKGINRRAKVGFLTILEALGYSKVGENYKTPLYPVWVVGSSDHYTALFALEESVVHMTEKDVLCKKIKTCFDRFDKFENGFIESKFIFPLLETIPLSLEAKSAVTEILRKNCELDQVLLYTQLLEAIEESQKLAIDWCCSVCTLTNRKVATSCEACGAKNPLFEKRKKRTSPIILYHFNGMKRMDNKSSFLSRVEVIEDSGYNLNSKEQNLRNIILTRWPDSEVHFVGCREEDAKI